MFIVGIYHLFDTLFKIIIYFLTPCTPVHVSCTSSDSKKNKLDLLTCIHIVLLRWKNFRDVNYRQDVDELSGG